MPTDQVFETFFGTLEKLSGLGYSPEQHQVFSFLGNSQTL